jgi:hypothetical protein
MPADKTLAQRIPIGKNQYIFTAGEGINDRADELVISSHGHFWFRAEEFTVPDWTTLHFYGPHKKALQDPTLASVGWQSVEAYEVFKPGSRARNYTLSKYQGRHGNKDETYERIAHEVELDREMVLNFLNASEEEQRKYAGTGMTFENWDVLTIRHRRFRYNPSLKSVLEVMGRTEQWRYPHIHCSFCRCRIGPWGSTYTAKKKT